MTKLDPGIQPEAWQQAVESANGKVPSHRIIKDVVQRIMERTKIPNTYQIGEVCQILAKDNPELRGKGGCWGIVNHVGEFSCTVTNVGWRVHRENRPPQNIPLTKSPSRGLKQGHCTFLSINW
ncbi:hypothetical protein [Nostoc sp.]|uniref:hypothetical protein n=1 Tax=Nostoc sp. TaxID=1180 RepID=UPI003FA56053